MLEGTLDDDFRPLPEASLRRAVRESDSSVGLVDLASRRWVELSVRACNQLFVDAAMLPTLDIPQLTAEPTSTLRFIALLQEGFLPRWKWRGRFKAPGGPELDLVASGHTLETDEGRQLCLVFYDPVALVRGEDSAAQCRGRHDANWSDANWSDANWSDANWSDVDPRTLLCHEFLDLVHPDDVEELSDVLPYIIEHRRTMTATMRVRDSTGAWHRISLTLRPEGETAPADRGAQLERHLWNIARELQAVGLGRTSPVPPIPIDLTVRQSEIVARLVSGERVPTIARAMYVSQKTVRTHLANVFRKVGVHSQAELLELLRRDGSAAELGAPMKT
jgi:DNA-binding CsgD family transcriptional regulator